jgi:hypothetical protein
VEHPENPFEDPEWEEFVTAVRTELVQKIVGSHVMVSIVPQGEVDVKFAVELGLGILLDKPIIVLAMPGVEVSEKLRLVADEVVEADIDLAEGRKELMDAIRRMGISVLSSEEE